MDRLELAYLAVLESPDLFQILETFDESMLGSILDRAASGASGSALETLRSKYPGTTPPPLWTAWMRAVHEDKLGRPPQAS